MSAEMNGPSTNDLERENVRLRSELSAARAREFHQRDAIRSLLTNGQLLDIEDVRAKIEAGIKELNLGAIQILDADGRPKGLTP